MEKNEPVVLLAAVRAVLVLLAAFGLIEFTDAETETVLAGVAGFYALVEIVITAIQRSRVTPTEKAVKNTSESLRASGANSEQIVAARRTIAEGKPVIPEATRR